MKEMNGDINSLEVMARREDWNDGVNLYARQVTVGAGFKIAQPMVLVAHEPNTIMEPFMRLPIQTAQNLIDELWQCGLRPTEGTGSAGSLKATQNHLSDLRKIVFKKLDIQDK